MVLGVLSFPRRVWLFARDYFNEFGVAWSLARMRDCDRNGGHRWSEPAEDLIGYGRTCERCGCSEYIYRTSGTTATNVTNYRIVFDHIKGEVREENG